MLMVILSMPHASAAITLLATSCCKFALHLLLSTLCARSPLHQRDIFSLAVQKPADNQQQQQQQRMPNGSYRGRGDPRRGRGRNDGPPGRGYRGGRGGQGPQGMQFNPPLDAAPNNPMAAGNPRSQDFNRDTARPQRMANEGGSQGQGRGMPFGRGNARGGGSYRGRGGRSNNAQKAQAVKPAGEDSKPGTAISFCSFGLWETFSPNLLAAALLHSLQQA